MSSPPLPQPLSGLRIVDLSRVMSGPYCTALLADMGAEVIKIETPGSGDDARHFGPFVDGRSVYFSLLNRGKKSMVLNLKDERARQVLYALVATADAVVENFRPGVADRLGVGAQALRAIRPDLVYLSISGFGQAGELSRRPAYDLIIQAMSGLMSTTGPKDGDPTCVGESVADVVSGLFGAWSLMVALYARERDGQGRNIDLSMFDAMLALQVTGASRLFASGQPPQRVGNRHPVTVPVDCFAARDGWAVLVVSNDEAFARLARLTGHEEWLVDVRLAKSAARAQHEPLLRDAIAAWVASRSVDEVVQACLDHDIPAGPVWDLKRAHATASQLQRPVLVKPENGRDEAQATVEAAWPMLLQPAVFDGQPVPAHRPEPRLGEHSVELLRELGLPVDAAGAGPLSEAGTSTATGPARAAALPAHRGSKEQK